MEYQKIANLLDSASNQPSKFRTRNWVEINDELKKSYKPGSDIKFKTTMLRSNLRDYADAYIPVKGTITIAGTGDDDAAKRLDERNKGVILKNCPPFTKCISRINNIDIDNAQDIDIVMPMHNLIEYSNNYLKTSGSLWQYYKEDPNDNIIRSESFKSKLKITGKTSANWNTKDVEIILPLKYLSNFWRTLEMTLITREINFVLTWSPTCVISSATGETKFKITNTKLYVPVVTLSTQDNRKLLQQLKSCFKRTINWNKYQSTPKTYRQNRCLSHLFDPIFQVVNRLFVLSFEHEDDKTLHSAYYLPKVEIKDYNVMNFGKKFFDQPINSDFKTYENIRKKATGQGDDYATGCLLDCSYFKKNYRMIAIDLIKQKNS